LEARNDVNTLVEFIYRPLFRAAHGQHGKGKNMHGKDAPEITIRVPVGTLVWDEKNELIVDMDEEGRRFLIGKGGRGGRGNTTFATAVQKAPRLMERGEPGEKKVLRLELKLLADVGIVGFPNAGKSTLLSRVTQAHPKIADYPFTTLEPQLGVVRLSEGRSFVLADIPGLIEGASQGKGLGIQFLRHLERTKLLAHLVELATLAGFNELEKRIKVIRNELKQHSPKFQKIPQLIVLTKADAATDKPVKDWVAKLKKKGTKVFVISAVSGEGLNQLMEESWRQLIKLKKETIKSKSEPKETLYQAKARFMIEREGDIFRVTGPEIKKWVAMTNFGNADALERFYKILQRMGVISALKKNGVQEGNVVYCDDAELFFESEQLGARNER
jgi:GTP-binding protein